MEKTFIYNNQETNYIITSDVRVFNKKTKKELKGTYNRNEYHSVQLTINGKPKSFMVHRLVAQMFCENPNNYNIVDHIDRNKYNNNYTNLRWVTKKENVYNRKIKNIQRKNQYIENFNENEWQQYKYTNYYVNKNGQIINIKTKRLLKGAFRNGYIRISFPEGKVSLHRIIWESYYGEIPEGKILDHIDGNRLNNKLENLRLVTQKENIINAMNNGHKSQIKIRQYDLKGNLIKEYQNIRTAAKEMGVFEGAIRTAANRRGTSQGYFWIKQSDNITIEEVLKTTSVNKPKKTYIGVTKYSITGKELEHYNSIKEAARNNNCSDSTIRRAADGKRIGKGFYWILDNQNIKIDEIIK